MRRPEPTLLRYLHVRRRPCLSERHLFVVWKSGRSMLRRHERHRSLRGGFGLQFNDHNGPVRPVRLPGRPLLRGQHLQQRLLFWRHLHGRRNDLRHLRFNVQLRFVQVWALHLRQLGRAVLLDQHFPDQHRLRDLRSELHGHHRIQRLVVRHLRQERWPVLCE